MEMSRKEILELVLKSLNEDKDMWFGDDNIRNKIAGRPAFLDTNYLSGEMPNWMYNTDIGLCVWTGNRSYGIDIRLLDNDGKIPTRGDVVLVPNWWNRISIFIKCRKIILSRAKESKVIVNISKRYNREKRLDEILSKNKTN